MKPVDKAASLTALGNTDEATSLEEPGNSDRYDNMTMFELQDELMKRRLHHIYPGRTFDDMRVRLRKSEELLRERGLKGRWSGFTNAEMASRLRVSDECLPHQIPKRWRLKEAPTYFASARAELYNGLTKAEIDLVLKARGLRSLGHKENVDDAIRCLVACDKGEAIGFGWLALGTKPVYSRLSSLDPSASPLAAAADDPVAKRARDYNAMFTYQHIVSMCKQEGLRWQAAGLSARVVNIRKDILCYRLALKEAAHVEEDWLLESLDIPKYAAKPKPDSERAARPQITNRGESSIDYVKLSFVALRLAVRGRGLSVLPDEELMAFKLMAHEHKGKLPESWFGPFGRQYYAHQPRVIELKNLGKDELVRRLREADIPAVTRQDLVNKLIKS
ncbi:uncharacterized protein EHS24_007612 [Apiotrichum porosum]|uniref:Uncharacterized protein n=1 Tax=Apiotrichum porosum TaxID=105984 RepID=A0A427XUW7_9TREE|nr:uncharacterized protein EHS24_007612 [Apiotrichum porosum]RSH82623.1 hypothetical protein EHS24_007612 [Apiotrichum porosum]